MGGQAPISHTSRITDLVNFIWDSLGTQYVTVTVNNNFGTVVETHAIDIYDAPISGLTAVNDLPTLLGEPTTQSATIQEGTNVIYTWDFGNGSGGSGQVTTHTYTAIGDFTATVTATNFITSLSATTQVTIITPGHHIYLPLVQKSIQSSTAPNFALPGIGRALGLIFAVVLGKWKEHF
jgi:hypothetical protein